MRSCYSALSNKPRLNLEPRQAPGRAVKKIKNKPRLNLEPRQAPGRAVKKKPNPQQEPLAYGARLIRSKILRRKFVFTNISRQLGNEYLCFAASGGGGGESNSRPKNQWCTNL